MDFVGDVGTLKTYNYLDMVNQLAWRAWRQLPLHTRSWIGVEDIVLDGLRWVEMDGFRNYDPRKSKLSTFITLGLSRYFQTEYVQRFVPSYVSKGKRRGSEKRCERTTTSIQDREQYYREAGMEFELERALGLPIASQKTLEQEFMNCLVVENMLKVHAQGTPELKVRIRDWFLGQASWRPTPKWHTSTWEFSRQAREFRVLAEQQGITIQDCRHLLSSPKCLDRLSRELTWLPFNFQYPISEVIS